MSRVQERDSGMSSGQRRYSEINRAQERHLDMSSGQERDTEMFSFM